MIMIQFGASAAMLAAEHGHGGVLQTLIQAKADLELKNMVSSMLCLCLCLRLCLCCVFFYIYILESGRIDTHQI